MSPHQISLSTSRIRQFIARFAAIGQADKVYDRDRHLRHLLRSYMHYYNGARTHLCLSKDAPISRVVQVVGRILPTPLLVDCTINTFGFNFR